MPDSSSSALSVAAFVPDDQLSSVLTTIHRAGFGHRARVVRGADASEAALIFGTPLPANESLLIVQAAAAAERVRTLLLGIGLPQVVLFQETAHSSTVFSIDRLSFSRKSRRHGSRPSPEPAQYPITDTNVSSE